ncbi:MAG TPA: hypothetical protein VLH80_07275 [Nitrospiraceae bacterium]|nr:hypothetical protein [Nitrospiraceae bacterium]
MARLILKYALTCEAQPQVVDMPRRARVLYVCMDERGPCLFAEVLQDADTKAFDVKHQRHFVVVMAGGVIPEGAGYIGSCVARLELADKARGYIRRIADYHVFEVRPGKATQL